MKIITDNAVYVQKNDIAYLTQINLTMPLSIFMKFIGCGNGEVTIDNSNKHEFIKFETPEEIEFFKNIDWIIDYNEVKDLTEEENMALGQRIAEEKNALGKIFNSMSEEQRKANMNIFNYCQLLDLKMYSLRCVLWFKQGVKELELPRGVELPDGLEPKRYYQIYKNWSKKKIN